MSELDDLRKDLYERDPYRDKTTGFRHCRECTLKPGCPDLCLGCLNNRNLMSHMHTENAALREALRYALNNPYEIASAVTWPRDVVIVQIKLLKEARERIARNEIQARQARLRSQELQGDP